MAASQRLLLCVVVVMSCISLSHMRLAPLAPPPATSSPGLCRVLQEWPSNAALLRGTLRLRGGKGGGRRRVAHSTTKMSLKHLKGVVKKKAERENLNAQAADNSNIQARQRNVERKANNYGEDGGLWEIMDPHNKRGGEESREGKSQKEKRARLARKMIEAGTSDVSSERGDAGERLIVDYGDMKRAADKLEAEKNAPRPLPDEDDEEDSMPAFGELLRIPPPEALMENAAEISALAEAPLPIRGWRQNQDGPPTGALIVPDQVLSSACRVRCHRLSREKQR